MSVKYEVSAITGTYTDREGNEKKRYAKLGVVLETKHGLMLKLETTPVNWEGFAYLNEPKPREEGQQQRRQAPRDEFEDDGIPFG